MVRFIYALIMLFSFDDANENWVRRSKRLNHKDIRALLVVKSYDEEVLCDFLSLSYKKAIITFPDIYVSVLEFCKNRKSPEVVSCLDYTGPRSVGEFLRPSGIFGRRPIEDFDIVQFVNMR